MIEVKKLDGSMMHLNEDLIERVEEAADGQCVVYLISGGHVIVANPRSAIVEKIRGEKANLFRRVLENDGGDVPPNVTTLSEVKRR